MGQVTTIGEVHTHNGVARGKKREEYSHVCLCAGVGLYIDIFYTKELLGAVNSQLLGYIDEFAAAVVALAGVTFGILVGENTALCFHNSLGYDVLRGDKLQLGALAAQLVFDSLSYGRVNFFQFVHHCHCFSLQIFQKLFVF